MGDSKEQKRPNGKSPRRVRKKPHTVPRSEDVLAAQEELAFPPIYVKFQFASREAKFERIYQRLLVMMSDVRVISDLIGDELGGDRLNVFTQIIDGLDSLSEAVYEGKEE